MALLEINAALFYTFFIGLLLVFAYCWRWRRYFELGMKLPGPPALPIIGNCLQFNNSLHNPFQELTEIASSYGPITRFWIGPILTVVVTDPDIIETVVKHDKIGRRGYSFRKSFEQAARNGLISLNGDEWRRHRKIVSAALHISILETFVENFAKNSDILANKLKDLADGITVHDIAPYLIRCTLDVMVQTSARMDINAQNGIEDSMLNHVTTIVHTISVRIMKPWLLIDWIFNASELGKKFYHAVKCTHDKINNELGKIKRMKETAEKTGQNEEKPSLLDLLIQYGDINKEEIIGEIATLVGAGTETTSHACGYVLALLGENQHIQERVMQEQQDIFGDDILRSVRSDDLPRMVYLEQVGSCFLRSSILSRIVAIFQHCIK
jgi:cytochrome P450 family 4